MITDKEVASVISDVLSSFVSKPCIMSTSQAMTVYVPANQTGSLVCLIKLQNEFYLVSLNVHTSKLVCIQSSHWCLSADLIPRLQIVSCNHHRFAALQNLLISLPPQCSTFL